MTNIRVRRVAASLAVAGAVVCGSAGAATATPSPVPLSTPAPQPGAAPTAGAPAAPAAEVRAQVRRGDLLADHGVRRTCPRCQSLVVTRSRSDARALSTSTPAGYGPAELASAYRLPSPGSGGARTTVAVIDAGVDPHLERDLAVYRRQYHLPPCTTADGCLRLQDYRGGAQPTPPQSADGKYVDELVGVETSLDVDAVSAGCPSCRLIEISVPWQDAVDDNDVSTGDFVRAVDTAERAGAQVISISYGFSADLRNTSGADLAGMTRPGTAIVASSGDDGFNGGAHQLWPSDLPSVVAGGGPPRPGGRRAAQGRRRVVRGAPGRGGRLGRRRPGHRPGRLRQLRAVQLTAAGLDRRRRHERLGPVRRCAVRPRRTAGARRRPPHPVRRPGPRLHRRQQR